MSSNDENITDVLEKIATLAPGVTESPRPASQALAKLQNELTASKLKPPSIWPAILHQKPVLIGTITVLVFAIAMTFPGVRAAANDFLGLFRVQKFAAISVSSEQVALLEKVAESGLMPGEVEFIEQPGEPYQVNTLQQAEGDLGWKARTSTIMEEPDIVYIVQGGSGRLTIDVESARSMLEIAGAEPGLLPDSLDGVPVDVVVYSGISQQWNDGLVLVQAPSPRVGYPEDVNPAALGQVLLQAVGVDELAASSLAQSIDWTTTLLLPIPEAVATFDDVSVDGEVGLALSSLDGNNAGLLWQRNGIVYALSGANVEDLIRIANSLE